MFKRLTDAYGIQKHEEYNMILGINSSPKESGEVDRIAMAVLSKKQRFFVLKCKANAIELLRETNPNAFNNNLILQMSDKLDEYNLLYRLYDDPVVYDWDWDYIQQLIKSPPDPLYTIMSTYWANPWAVIHLVKLPISAEQWVHGFNPRSLQAVRDYFTSEDPWCLRTGCPNEVQKIFSILFKKGWVYKKGDHWLPNKKHRKNAPRCIQWRKHSEKFGMIRDISPSFSQMLVEQIPKKFPKITVLDEMPSADNKALFIGFTKWDLGSCPGPHMCEWDGVEKAIFSAKIYTRVVFIVRPQMKCQLELPHSIYPTTRLGGAAGFVHRCFEKRLNYDNPVINFLILVIS